MAPKKFDKKSAEAELRYLIKSVAQSKEEIEQLLKKAPEPAVVEQINSILNLDFTALKSTIETLTKEIILNLDEEADDYVEEESQLSDQLRKFRKEFHNLVGRVQAFTKPSSSLVSPAPADGASSGGESAVSAPLRIHVPNIPVPKFDGKPTNFFDFKHMFVRVVHENKDLHPVQKLWYLKDCLREGTAESLLKDFELSDAAYPLAWDYFLKRYENKKLIIRTHFRNLLCIQPISSESELKSLLDKVSVIVRGLRICGEPIDGCMSAFITYFISTKLDASTRRDFDNACTDVSKHPDFDVIQTFLIDRCCSIDERVADNVGETGINMKGRKAGTVVAHHNTRTVLLSAADKNDEEFSVKCLLCSNGHFLNLCPQFLTKNPVQRFDVIKANRLCINCLKPRHIASECRATTTCKFCQQRHHYLLHRDRRIPGAETTESSGKHSTDIAADAAARTKSSLSSLMSNKDVLLPTAVVRLFVNNKVIFARALLDVCSQPNLVSESFVKRHNVKIMKDSVSEISSIGGNVTSTKYSTWLEVGSRFSDFAVDTEFDVVSKIPYNVSNSALVELQKTVKGINLAETNLRYSDVDMIIGAEHYEDCMLDEKFKEGSVTFRRSRFGWIISGPVGSTNSENKVCGLNSFALEEQLRKFWEIEEVAEPGSERSEYEACNAHFENTISRNDEGRFIVRLPFKPDMDPYELGDNYCSVLRSFRQRDNRLSPIQKAEYSKFMDEYLQLDHMELVTGDDLNSFRYFIPHRIVEKPSSTTTKYRVVFNASYRAANGKSLNDLLMNGPSIQSELFDLLVSFRLHVVAFICDIAKMYRQIRVHEQDANCQRILWRQSDGSINVYRLKTLTYGTKPASFIATKCLEVLADELEPNHPNEANLIRSSFYMDDLLVGASTVPDAVELQRIIHQTLASGCFPLRKYVSNSDEFLRQVDPDLVAPDGERNLPFEFATLVLGLTWVPKEDHLKIVLDSVREPSLISKRSMLSSISRVFDVLGILTPVTVRGKLLMQKLWKENMNWDDEVGDFLKAEFLEYLEDVTKLNSVSIPRCYFYGDEPCSALQLIGFCDASLVAYCAVCYIRYRSRTGDYRVSFVCSKSKVAPIKQPLTIPRLELEATCLLSRLMIRVASKINVESSNFFMFSDSQIVLAWLSREPQLFQTFVSNRVSKVQSLVPKEKWFYVNTIDNPADLGTRGIRTSKFVNERIWFNGPEFLSVDFVGKKCNDSNIQLPEVRKVCNLNANVVELDYELLDRYSSFSKLRNVTCYLLRFIRRQRPTSVVLSVDELESSFLSICRLSQLKYFAIEISRLRDKNVKFVGKFSLMSLNPFIDDRNILRVGGRLKNSSLPYERKHPMILSAKCSFSKLYVKYLHEKYFHCSRLIIICHLQRFWFIGSINRVIKHVIHSCQFCRTLKAKTMSQIMGQLPIARVNMSRPFSHVGVDACGPFKTKCVGHRSVKYQKSYAVFFVCFAVKAVHIEVMSDMSTPAFLAAFRRFASRRGVPGNVYSDNGSNFVGADNLFRLNEEAILEFAGQDGITWSFNPPLAAHFGGLWEAAIKSGKSHLVKVTKEQVLTFEELSTVFAQVEALLNSRPLCRDVTNHDATAILTPSHFLTGTNITMLPEFDDLKGPLSSRWCHMQQIISSFWRVWYCDYLNQLQRRGKWPHEKENLKIGDLVLLKDDRTKPLNWSKGIVSQVFPDADGAVRSVELETAHGVFRRPIAKLVLLNDRLM